MGITCVHGCEVEGMLDEEGRVIEEGRTYFFKTTIQVLRISIPYSTGPEPKPNLQGNQRTWRVWLDTNQYQRDMEATVQGAEVCTFCCPHHQTLVGDR